MAFSVRDTLATKIFPPVNRIGRIPRQAQVMTQLPFPACARAVIFSAETQLMSEVPNSWKARRTKPQAGSRKGDESL